MNSSERRLTLTCLVLVGITLMSWAIGVRHGHHAFSLNAGITIGVIVMAAVKVRIIAWEFMELRHAPLAMRRIADGLLAGLMTTLLVLYLVAA